MTDGALSPSDLAPRRHPLAVPALILALVASAAALPYALSVGGDMMPPGILGWMFTVAPLLGITSLVMASVASRQIKRSPDDFTGRDLVVAAKAVAWLGAVVWTFGLFLLMAAIGVSQYTTGPGRTEPFRPDPVIRNDTDEEIFVFRVEHGDEIMVAGVGPGLLRRTLTGGCSYVLVARD